MLQCRRCHGLGGAGQIASSVVRMGRNGGDVATNDACLAAEISLLERNICEIEKILSKNVLI